MYVCVCTAVTERHIQQAVRDGGVRNMRALQQTLGVSKQCGRCGSCARDVLEQSIAQIDEVCSRNTTHITR